MFEVGDYTVHGSNGVCKVIEIGRLDINTSNKDKIFYTLQPVYTKGSKVYTPVDNERIVMRKILSKEEAIKLIDDIPNISMIWEENDKVRDEKFKEAMKKYDCREWIRIIKALYNRKQERISQGKKITHTDEKYLDTAEDFLYGELSIPLNIPKENMEDYIVSRLNG